MIAFPCLKPLWPKPYPYPTYPIWLSIPKTLLKHDHKIQMQEGQVMPSPTTTEVSINIGKAKDEALDVITSPWY
jgi:ABC-type uncharacterized transport system involved in gliding motility auxiliary subunit